MTSFWKDRPVLVTGGTGLLGSWLVADLIEAGADVVCLVRDWVPQSELVRTGSIDKVKIVRGDICDRELIERTLGEYEIEVVFHLAAQTIVGIANRNPVSTFSTNIGGTWSLLEACRRSPKVASIVVASSDKAYGDQEHLPYDESMALQGHHPYDVSKSCADLIAQTYAATYNLPVAITRCGNFYGGGDLNWNRVVPGTIRSILRGERPIIRSDGQFVRDYFYIQDGAAAYMLLAERLASNLALRGQAFNFSNESQVSVLEIVDLILRKMNSSLRAEIQNQASNEIGTNTSAPSALEQCSAGARHSPSTRAWIKQLAGIASSWAYLQRERIRRRDSNKVCTNMFKSPQQLRAEIGGLVKEYYETALAPQPFKPGDTAVPVSGKVIDSSELQHLVEASLDGWLTTGRFAAEFERDFAAFMGVRCALLVNSGSSANLVALSCLTSPSLGERRLRAGGRSYNSGCRFSDHGQSHHPKRTCPGLRRRSIAHLQRRRYTTRGRGL